MLVLDTAPTAEPISLEEAKLQLRVESDFTDEDVYIESLIADARVKAAAPFTERQASRECCRPFTD